MVKDALREAEARMRGSIQALEDDLGGIRTGRASPALVETIRGLPTRRRGALQLELTVWQREDSRYRQLLLAPPKIMI